MVLRILSVPQRLQVQLTCWSAAFRIAFQGEGGGQDYGLAGAIATVIFLIVGALALLNMKLSKVENI